MKEEIKRIHGGFKNVPKHLKTKTELNGLGLRPGGPAKAQYWTAYQWSLLYELSEAVPKRVASKKQLAALVKARQAIEEKRTCDVCRVYVSKENIRHGDGEKICVNCLTEREEKEYFANSKEFFVSVAGTYYVGDKIVSRVKQETILKLEREPDNPHDSDAVKVMASFENGWAKIGYVPARFAEVVAPRMDNDEFVGIENEGIRIGEFEHYVSYEENSVEYFKIVDIRIFFEKEELV